MRRFIHNSGPAFAHFQHHILRLHCLHDAIQYILLHSKQQQSKQANIIYNNPSHNQGCLHSIGTYTKIQTDMRVIDVKD